MSKKIFGMIIAVILVTGCASDTGSRNASDSREADSENDTDGSPNGQAQGRNGNNNIANPDMQTEADTVYVKQLSFSMQYDENYNLEVIAVSEYEDPESINLLREAYYDSTGHVYNWTEFSYEDNELTARKEYEGDGSIRMEAQRSFDNNGQTVWDHSGAGGYKDRIVYDTETSQMISEEGVTSEGKAFRYDYEYEYDNDKLMKKIKYKNGSVEVISLYYRDVNGYAYRVEDYDGNGNLIDWYEYERDEHGNSPGYIKYKADGTIDSDMSSADDKYEYDEATRTETHYKKRSISKTTYDEENRAILYASLSKSGDLKSYTQLEYADVNYRYEHLDLSQERPYGLPVLGDGWIVDRSELRNTIINDRWIEIPELDGKQVYGFLYSQRPYDDYTEPFSYAPVDDYCYLVRDNKKFGLMRIDGNWFLEPEYAEVTYSYGYYINTGYSYDDEAYTIKNGNLSRLSDWDGHTDINGTNVDPQMGYDDFRQCFVTYEGNGGIFVMDDNYKYSGTVACSKFIGEDAFYSGTPIDYSLAVITNNKRVTDYMYEDACPYSDGLMAVKKDGKWGYVNDKGKEVIPCVYDGIRVGNPGYKYSLANSAINYPDSYTFDNILDWGDQSEWAFGAACTEGYVVVKKDGAYGLLDSNNNTVIPFGVFENLTEVKDGKLFAKKDGKWGIYTIK